MTEALTLTVIGMAVVFVALGLMCGAFVVLGWLDRRAAPAVAASSPSAPPPEVSKVSADCSPPALLTSLSPAVPVVPPGPPVSPWLPSRTQKLGCAA